MPQPEFTPKTLLSPGQCERRARDRGVTFTRSWWRIQMLTGALRSTRAGRGVFARCADVDARIAALLAERAGDSRPVAA